MKAVSRIGSRIGPGIHWPTGSCLAPIFLGLLLLWPGWDSAEAKETPPAVTVEAQAHATGAGAFTVYWRLTPTEHWHLYSDRRNDSGFPPRLTLDWPTGWQVGPLQWPVAERHIVEGGILDHVYHGTLTLLQEVRPAPGALASGPVRLTGVWDWLVCRQQCVPGRTTVDIVFGAGSSESPPPITWQEAAHLLPRPAPAGAVVSRWSGATVALTVTQAVGLEFHPAPDCVRLVDLLADGASTGSTLTLRLREGPDGFGPLRGILKVELNDGRSVGWTVDLPHGG